MDLGTNLRGVRQGTGFDGLEGPGFRFFTGFDPVPCLNPRRFVPKSTKVLWFLAPRTLPKSTKAINIIMLNPFVDLGTNLRGFGHKPSWIWAQTFVDLGTDLRGFRQGTGFDGLEGPRVQVFHWHRGPGFRFFTFVPRGPRVQVFHWRRGPRVQVYHWFCACWDPVPCPKSTGFTASRP